MLSATDALNRLREGNQRFVASIGRKNMAPPPFRSGELIVDQRPCAVILGCSDSRVPAEMIFDQGLGDLFVIRVAGNIVAPSQIGSVEFAVENFGTPLVVVLGHTRCGAVHATIDQLQRPTESQSPNLRSIVDRIRPAVEGLLDTELGLEPDALMRHAIRANVRASANQLRHSSKIIEDLVVQEKVAIVGAEYAVESGEVVFFDSLPVAR